MNAPVSGGAEQVFARFLDLERQTRAARTPAQLAYSLVNDGQALFGFRHAALLIAGKVQAVTGVSAVEPNSPFVAFVEQAVAQLFKGEQLQQARVIAADLLSESLQAEWQSLSAAQVFWLPLIDRQGEVFGGLWLARDVPWNPGEQVLLSQLGDTYSHAWQALQPRKPWRLRWTRKRQALLVAMLLLGLLIPVRQSVLAPAEVVPLGGRVVAAPLDGVIAEFLVKPNQTVKTGDLLLRFESTTLKAQADVAGRALGVAEAELKANSQRSFADAESSSKLDLLAARVEQKRAERDYARELLKRSEVRAERDGIAVFADAERWTGKPVQTGERLMEIAIRLRRNCVSNWPWAMRFPWSPAPRSPCSSTVTRCNGIWPGSNVRLMKRSPRRAGSWPIAWMRISTRHPRASVCAARRKSSVTGRRWRCTCYVDPWPVCVRAWACK